MPKLEWKQPRDPEYHEAKLVGRYVLLVQPVVEGNGKPGSIGVYDVTEIWSETDDDHIAVDDWLISEPRTQADPIEAMNRCEELAREWLKRECGGLL